MHRECCEAPLQLSELFFEIYLKSLEKFFFFFQKSFANASLPTFRKVKPMKIPPTPLNACIFLQSLFIILPFVNPSKNSTGEFSKNLIFIYFRFRLASVTKSVYFVFGLISIIFKTTSILHLNEFKFFMRVLNLACRCRIRLGWQRSWNRIIPANVFSSNCEKLFSKNVGK